MSHQGENINKKNYLYKRPNRNYRFEKVVTKMKNSIEGWNSRYEQSEETINQLEDGSIEITQSEEQKE